MNSDGNCERLMAETAGVCFVTFPDGWITPGVSIGEFLPGEAMVRGGCGTVRHVRRVRR